MRRSLVLVAASLAGALVACAGSRSPDTTVTAGTNRRVITYQELQQAVGLNYGNAYQYIQSRRSEWFIPTNARTRGQAELPSVWLDTQRLGDLSTLRTIQLTSVIEIRLLSPSEAQAQLGLNNLGGAIVARTR